jgi:phage terminase large subunit
MSRAEYVIIEDRSGTSGYRPRGAAAQLWKCRAPEVIIAGPAETGKTYACLMRLHAYLWKHPRTQGAMLRKEYAALVASALQTYRKKIIREDDQENPCPCIPYGGEKPEWFDYPNGSRLWIGGLDRPGKVLSTDRDIIYVNQAEELELNDWGTVSSRVTGRAGNGPYAQLLGDANPGPPQHWIRQREAAGQLLLLESKHEDNPLLYNDDGTLTEQGKLTLSRLDSLPGILYDRLRLGQWVSAEGAVYRYSDRIHTVGPEIIRPEWTRFRSVDFGFTNPFVCLWLALDGDGRLYLYREIYRTGRTVRAHAEQIKRLTPPAERIVITVADHDREDIATLHENGIGTVPADKGEIQTGIQQVQTRLQVAGDNRPRLFIVRGCLVERDDELASKGHPTCTREEFDRYLYPKGQDGKPVKENPIDAFNHGLDALRYAVRWADVREKVGAGKYSGGGQPAATSFRRPPGPAAGQSGKMPSFRDLR